MHRDHVNADVGDRGRHGSVGKACRDIVDENRTRLDRGSCDARVHGVDRDRNALTGQRRDHRDDAASLFVRGHRLRSRTSRFPAHVNDVRSGCCKAKSVRDRRVGREVATAIAEGIGRDVEDAHDERALGLGKLRHRYFPTMRLIASARVAASRIAPRTALVTVREPGLRTPRIDIHRCSASTTTMTPRAPKCSTKASAT